MKMKQFRHFLYQYWLIATLRGNYGDLPSTKMVYVPAILINLAVYLLTSIGPGKVMEPAWNTGIDVATVFFAITFTVLFQFRPLVGTAIMMIATIAMLAWAVTGLSQAVFPYMLLMGICMMARHARLKSASQ